MRFKNRVEVGKLLANKLKDLGLENPIVYGIPRGGLVCAKEIARILGAPLSAIIVRKIPHPNDPEYAIGAVAEDGDIELAPDASYVDEVLFKKMVQDKREEAKNRREYILLGENPLPAEGRTAIIVDDGLATGLTMMAALKEIKHLKPSRIIIAVGVLPSELAKKFESDGYEVVALDIPNFFLMSVGNYYEEFDQVSDEEAREIIIKMRSKKI